MRLMSLRKNVAGGLALALVASGLVACSKSNPGSGPADKRRSGMAVPVVVAIAQQKNVPVELQTIGNARAFASVSVKARVDGELAQVNFRQGDEVKKDAQI